MASQQNLGHPVQIVRLEGGKGCRLDRNALVRILLDDNVKDLPVVVVSVAGIFRKGKSFLLNFFLRYMQNRTQGDWMADDNVPLRGFPWRGGAETETMGIWIWDEVFVVTTSEGKKVAVIFLDTQGTFDNRSTDNNIATIFVLSMLASSVQIYNISQNIGSDHLQHLQLFTEYGKLALKDTTEKPFQKLLFLVRDWQYHYETEYGFEGGNSLLQKRLEISNELHPELQRLRRDIQSCFSEISCFLMPHPGTKVATERCFVGCLSDIEADFKQQLRVLVSSVLEPNKLVVKKINGSDVTCRHLLDYFWMFGKIFNEGGLPDAKPMFEASVEAQNSTAVDRAIDHYRNGMETVFDEDRRFLDLCSLLEHHLQKQQSALQLFESTPKLGGAACSEPYKKRLQKMIDEEFKRISLRNESQRIKAEEERIKEEAREEARKILDEANAECEKIRLTKATIDLAAKATAQFVSAAYGGSSTAAQAVGGCAALVELATTLYEKIAMMKLIAKGNKEEQRNALENIKALRNRLEECFREMQKPNGKASTAEGETSIDAVKTLLDKLTKILADQAGDEGDAHQDGDQGQHAHASNK